MRVNSFFRSFAFLLHSAILTIGLAFIVLCFYLIFADWGDQQDPSFFLGTGLIVGLMGLIILTISYIGNQGISNQLRSYNFWTGQRMIVVYIVLETLLLIAFIVFYILSLNATIVFRDTYEALEKDPNSFLKYTTMESTMEGKFNSFFFSASCESVYVWFWKIVNDVCPSDISRETCQKCYPYSVTMCQADADTCYRSQTAMRYNDRCPYTLCRAGILKYVDDTVSSVLWGLVAFMVLLAASILVHWVLAIHQYKNTGTIKVVPIEDEPEVQAELAPAVLL